MARSLRVLITGGAGFIGSHVADELLRAGYDVRALDNLTPQVHGDRPARPSYLHRDVEFVRGDVRDRADVRKALRDIDAVIHLAAAVGVGQSMYQIVDYTDVNNLGTATLLETIIERPVQRLVVASSMSIYGEGLYRAPDGTPIEGLERPRAQLERGDWELRLPNGERALPVATPESKRPSLASVYALSKYDQERLALMLGAAYGIPTTALRFFNVYGPRQALSNPYTGVLAIFASRLLNGRPPLVFEDGEQRRDFVSVYDVARACRLALESDAADVAFNIGSGSSYTVREIAERIARAVGRERIEPRVTGQYRVGDIRHCFADISLARRVLGYEPQVAFDRGITELAGWLERQPARPADNVAKASRELSDRGLTVGKATRTTPASKKHVARPGKKPVLITGGAGFIGSNVAHRLLSDGHSVLLYDNLSRPGVERNLSWLRSEHGNAFELEVADVRDAGALSRAVRASRQVFHFAAQVAVTTSLDDPVHDFSVNARGTLNLLEAARACAEPPPVVFTSTNKVYGALDDVVLTCTGMRYEPFDLGLRAFGVNESRALQFHSPYGCSKGTADQYVLDYARSYELPHAVLRMSCIYGPHQWGNEDQGWVAHFMRRAMRHEPIDLYGDGMQVRDILYIDDLVNAMLLAQEHMPQIAGHAFNIGGGPENAVSLRELLMHVAEYDGGALEVTQHDWRVGDQRYYVSDTTAFSNAVGWYPAVGVIEGINRLHEWLVTSQQAVRPPAAAATRTGPERRRAVRQPVLS
jgi:dTDP-L-rhamnose 4-epimerase